MIVLYAMGLALLGVAAFLAGRRARTLERKYVAAAKAAERLVHDLSMKNGNRSHLDPCVNAKKTYELGVVVQKRDRLETKYAAWESRSENLKMARTLLRSWKGRKAPYLMGAIDAALIVAALVAFGAVQFDARELIDKVRAVVSR